MSMEVPASFFQAKVSRLAALLLAIKAHDADYDTRNPLVLEAMYHALLIGFKTGVRFDPNEPAWPVVYIELPQGQVSWHLPEHDRPWDGHTTEEKYQRTDQFCRATLGQEMLT